MDASPNTGFPNVEDLRQNRRAAFTTYVVTLDVLIQHTSPELHTVARALDNGSGPAISLSKARERFGQMLAIFDSVPDELLTNSEKQERADRLAVLGLRPPNGNQKDWEELACIGATYGAMIRTSFQLPSISTDQLKRFTEARTKRDAGVTSALPAEAVVRAQNRPEQESPVHFPNVLTANFWQLGDYSYDGRPVAGRTEPTIFRSDTPGYTDLMNEILFDTTTRSGGISL